MRVRSERLTNGQRPARRAFAWDRIPLALLGSFFLLLWWAAGGKYTIDGLPLLLNEIAAFFRAPVRLGPIADWRWYVILAWLPVLISIVERRFVPWRRAASGGTMVWMVGVWLAVAGVDALSTWLAITRPSADAYRISRQIAALPEVAVAWALATTFLPEIGMVALWRGLRR